MDGATAKTTAEVVEKIIVLSERHYCRFKLDSPPTHA